MDPASAPPHDPLPEHLTGGPLRTHKLARWLRRKYWYDYDPHKMVAPPAWESLLYGFMALAGTSTATLALAVAQIFAVVTNVPGAQIGMVLVSIAAALGGSLWAGRVWLHLERLHGEFLGLAADRRYTFKTGVVPYVTSNGRVIAPGIPREILQDTIHVTFDGPMPAYLRWTILWPFAVGRVLALSARRSGVATLLDWIGILPLLMTLRQWIWPTNGGATASQALANLSLAAEEDLLDDPDLAKIEPRHDNRWEIKWVPFAKFQRPDKTWVKKLLLDKTKENAAFANLSQWLQEQHPAHHQVVLDWFAYRFTALCGGTADTTPTSQAYVDYLEGCLVAAHPEEFQGYHFPPGVDWDPTRDLVQRLKALPPLVPDPSRPARPAFPTSPNPLDLFLGIGFIVTEKHAQSWTIHSQFPVSEITKQTPGSAKDLQGEPRTFGMGRKDRRPIHTEKKNLRQHCTVLGTTGVGKTRTLEQMWSQVLTGGDPGIFVDPKGDFDLIDRTYEVARAAGRAHQVYYCDLAKPKNPNISTYNPFFHYHDPSYLGDRAGAVIVDSSEPFWKDQAKATARRIFSLVHYVREYLRLIDRRVSPDGSRFVLAAKTSDRVPTVLLVMQWMADNPGGSIDTAFERVKEIITHLDDSAYQPKSSEASTLALARTEEFTPRYWNPRFFHLNAFIDKTHEMFAWSIKVVNFHATLTDVTFRNPHCPRILEAAKVVAGAGGAKAGDPKANGNGKDLALWDAIKQAGTNPLQLTLPRQNPMPGDLAKWGRVFQHFVPITKKDQGHVEEIMANLRLAFDAVASWIVQDRARFLEMNTTLATALVRFQGDRATLVSSLTPHIRWDRVIPQNQIVYINCNANLDGDGAMGMSKMIVQDVASYVGTIYDQHQRTQGDPKQFYLFIDEIRYAVNDAVPQLLAMARGAGCSVTLAGQTLANLRVGLGGDKDKQIEVTSNVSTFIQMRAGNNEDAEEFEKKCGKKSITKLSRNLNLNEPQHGQKGLAGIFSAGIGISTSREDVPLVRADQVLQLPRGMAFIHNMGGEVDLVTVGMFPKPTSNIKAEFGTITAEDEEAMATLWERAKVIGESDPEEADRIRLLALRLDEEFAVTEKVGAAATAEGKNVAAEATTAKAESLFSAEERLATVKENVGIAAKLNAEMQKRADTEAAKLAAEKKLAETKASTPQPPPSRPTGKGPTPPSTGTPGAPTRSPVAPPSRPVTATLPPAASVASLRPTDPLLNAPATDPTALASGWPSDGRYTEPHPTIPARPEDIVDDPADDIEGFGSRQEKF